MKLNEMKIFCPQCKPWAYVSTMNTDFIYPYIDCEPYTVLCVGGVPTLGACHRADNTWLDSTYVCTSVITENLWTSGYFAPLNVLITKRLPAN